MKNEVKRKYLVPCCSNVIVQEDYSLLAGSVHVTVNKDSSNDQGWDYDNRSEGTPNQNGSNPDDSWFGTTSEVAP